MELTELVYFTTIAQTGNMSRAAKKLQVSQPALSVAVRKLERDLNMQLFVRANNSIILNAAGKKAVVFAENILSQVSEMRHFFRAPMGSVTQRLRWRLRTQGHTVWCCLSSSRSVRKLKFLPYCCTRITRWGLP